MPQRNCLMTLKILLISSITLLQGCSVLGFFKKPEPTVVVKTEYVERIVPIQSRPGPLSLLDVKFYAVTKENFAEFETRFTAENNELVFFAMSVPAYENLSINMAEIKRYIEQQGAIIIYYEAANTKNTK